MSTFQFYKIHEWTNNDPVGFQLWPTFNPHHAGVTKPVWTLTFLLHPICSFITKKQTEIIFAENIFSMSGHPSLWNVECPNCWWPSVLQWICIAFGMCGNDRNVQHHTWWKSWFLLFHFKIIKQYQNVFANFMTCFCSDTSSHIPSKHLACTYFVPSWPFNWPIFTVSLKLNVPSGVSATTTHMQSRFCCHAGVLVCVCTTQHAWSLLSAWDTFGKSRTVVKSLCSWACPMVAVMSSFTMSLSCRRSEMEMQREPHSVCGSDVEPVQQETSSCAKIWTPKWKWTALLEASCKYRHKYLYLETFFLFLSLSGLSKYLGHKKLSCPVVYSWRKYWVEHWSTITWKKAPGPRTDLNFSPVAHSGGFFHLYFHTKCEIDCLPSSQIPEMRSAKIALVQLCVLQEKVNWNIDHCRQMGPWTSRWFELAPVLLGHSGSLVCSLDELKTWHGLFSTKRKWHFPKFFAPLEIPNNPLKLATWTFEKSQAIHKFWFTKHTNCIWSCLCFFEQPLFSLFLANTLSAVWPSLHSFVNDILLWVVKCRVLCEEENYDSFSFFTVSKCLRQHFKKNSP